MTMTVRGLSRGTKDKDMSATASKRRTMGGTTTDFNRREHSNSKASNKHISAAYVEDERESMIEDDDETKSIRSKVSKGPSVVSVSKRIKMSRKTSVVDD